MVAPTREYQHLAIDLGGRRHVITTLAWRVYPLSHRFTPP
jgi:hypothetical protein